MNKIVDYNDIYVEQIDSEEKKYWGDWEYTSIKDNLEDYDIFKIVLKDNTYAGHLYGKFIGDLFYFDVFIIKEEFRNQKLGTFLLENLIETLKKHNIKTIATTAEYLHNKVALKPC